MLVPDSKMLVLIRSAVNNHLIVSITCIIYIYTYYVYRYTLRLYIYIYVSIVTCPYMHSYNAIIIKNGLGKEDIQ